MLIFYSIPALRELRWAREAFLWPLVLGWGFLYWRGSALFSTEKAPTVRAVFWIGGLLTLLAVLTPPFHSRDLYGYINRGWEQAHYGLNPYVTLVGEIPGWRTDPMLTDHWVSNPCPYGFFFALWTWGLCGLGQGDLPATAMLFKLSNGLLHLGLGWVIWRSAQTLGFRQPALALYLYLWNPLMLIHAVANGHNDILMVFLTALAFWMAFQRRWWAVFPLLIAATLVKYTVVVLLPLAGLYGVRQGGWRQGMLTSGLGLLTLGLLGLPYWPDVAHFRWEGIGTNASLSHHSLHAMVMSMVEGLGAFWPWLQAYQAGIDAALRRGLFGGFLLAYLALFVHLARQGLGITVSQWVTGSVIALFLLVCGVSAKFHVWYLGMVFPLALLLEAGHPLRRLLMVLSVTHLLALTFIGQAHILNVLLMLVLPVVIWAVWQKRASHPTVPVASP